MKIDYLDDPNQNVHIEILPLIDVIFCILTFFILAAVGLTRQQAIDLDLPAANTGAPLPAQGLGAEAALQERLYVSVDAIGQVYLDQQPVTVDLLYDVLQQHQQSYPDGLIVLYASRDARYEDVVSVLDLLRSVGGNRVALATLPNAIANPDTLTPNDLLTPQPGLGEDPFAPQPSTGDPLLPSTDDLLTPGTGTPGTLPAVPGEGPEIPDYLQQLPPDGAGAGAEE
jgi:biopolymer transport protein ExbD